MLLLKEVISMVKKTIERINSNGINSYFYNYRILYDYSPKKELILNENTESSFETVFSLNLKI